MDTPQAKPYVLRGHGREVTAVAWCPTDSHSVATCGDDATVKLWSVQRPWPPAPKTTPGIAPQVQPPLALRDAYCCVHLNNHFGSDFGAMTKQNARDSSSS